jgi:hypothetical protein
MIIPMNLKTRLENEHSKTLTLEIIKYVGNDAIRFKKLLDLVLGSDKIVSQRASWPFGYAAIEHPEFVKPHISKLIKKLATPTNHPAITRSILRVFQEIDIPQKHWGTLVDLSFKFILNESEPIATRAFAISVAARICKHYPELKKELLLILTDLRERPHAPAIAARIKFALKELNRLETKI